MAHAQKPDFVFQAKRTSPFKSAGGHQFSRLPAAEVCALAGVMLDTPCSEVVWRVLATHCIRQFPLHFPSRASPCAITFQLEPVYGVAKLKGSPHQDNFESKPAVRAVMCSAKYGTLKYSWICLLLTYQVTRVASRRHSDCNTCNLPTWLLEDNLHTGHEWVVCTAVPHYWWRDHFSTGEEFIIRKCYWTVFKPLALELDINSLAHHLGKMWIFYEPRTLTLGNTRHFVEE